MIAGFEYDERVESYRQLRTQVLKILRDNQWNTLAVTSAHENAGKTLTAVNLGVSISREVNQTVLLVDLDPQGALAVGLGVRPHQLDRAVYDLFMQPGTTVDDVMPKTSVPGMALLPSNIDLSAAEVALVNEVAREHALARGLASVIDRYDYIIIDCQPSLGLLTINALTAAHGVIIPLECEYFALRGVELLTDTVTKVQGRLNPNLQLTGVLATMYDARTLHTREVLDRVVDAFGDQVFHTVISRTIKFPDATVAGEPITVFAPSSPGADSYRQLARELIAK